MRDKREFETASFAPITVFIYDDLSRATFGAEDVFSEDDAPNVFFNLRLGWYLFEMVHVLHYTSFVPFDLETVWKAYFVIE